MLDLVTAKSLALPEMLEQASCVLKQDLLQMVAAQLLVYSYVLLERFG